MTENVDIYFHLRKVSRLLSLIFNIHLRKYKITPEQYNAIKTIDSYPGIHMTKLAEKIGIDRTTFGRNVKPILKLGYVRQAEVSNMREKYLEITEKGRQMLMLAEGDYTRADSKVKKIIMQNNCEGFIGSVLTLSNKFGDLDS